MPFGPALEGIVVSLGHERIAAALRTMPYAH
jgi:hypothetical protein